MGRLAQYYDVMSNNMYQIIKQGEIPDSIWNHPNLKRYIGADARGRSRSVGGYIGDGSRTLRTDRFLIQILRGDNVPDGEIAEWLTSTSGRHLMDGYEPGMSDVALKKYLRHNTRGIRVELREWRIRNLKYTAMSEPKKRTYKNFQIFIKELENDLFKAKIYRPGKRYEYAIHTRPENTSFDEVLKDAKALVDDYYRIEERRRR